MEEISLPVATVRLPSPTLSAGMKWRRRMGIFRRGAGSGHKSGFDWRRKQGYGHRDCQGEKSTACARERTHGLCGASRERTNVFLPVRRNGNNLFISCYCEKSVHSCADPYDALASLTVSVSAYFLSSPNISACIY